ncbi:methyltransferase domain-containing protein [Azospirillum brasilense]|uniref:Class I SAM-dependent methyltransferase n=1 Tax=Azospirillum brasilense TaxID=192 RepID=A0A0P0F5Q9_AZOBR|nr:MULTISPECIES: class I SAM-dependent methyltransferase [Azospirillum]ALJ38424.1 methyltransferase [Azospirillum brasilense]MDW7554213.1 class I SAM-dependent methyltransferase [Azospirillum brasilense]MDW7594430.1 class I SAM-dependent methyltransferase [Azospirillum brasilense]MDW7630062.1 class I SAM-dependent methyltransferase [Azospirillum brasilense]MDX5955521.1 class I SAM-dependent methyltransferase [Azospirillum brasilense]
MTVQSIFMPEAIYRYMLDTSLRETAIQAKLRAETAKLTEAHYQIAPEEGQLLAFLVEMIGARRTLDIGTFTGYSALTVAQALPDEGRVVSLDINEQWTAKARAIWSEAGVAEKIELHIGPALDSLDKLLTDGGGESFDFAFIDADKESYDAYYERCLTLVRRGGLIVVDNTLWRGRVADPGDRKDKTEAIRAFNAARLRDERVGLCMLPIGDGVTLLRRR